MLKPEHELLAHLVAQVLAKYPDGVAIYLTKKLENRVTTIDDLKGFCYPLTPGGISSLVGELPWHYATEYLNIAYRADPQAIAARLPEPLAPGPEPDMAYVAFSKWWSLWDNQSDMAFVNPERTHYRECAIWVGCSFKGIPGQICLHIWVDNRHYRE